MRVSVSSANQVNRLIEGYMGYISACENAAEPPLLLGSEKLIYSLAKAVNRLTKEINNLRDKGVNEFSGN